MLQITEEHVEKFEQIKRRFISKTRVPLEDNWRLKTSNEIWLEIVAQVVIVGNSQPWEKLKGDSKLLRTISYESLKRILDQYELTSTINSVLRRVGARYASSDASKSAKAKALAYNLDALRHFRGGPKGFLEHIVKLKEFDEDKAKIRFVMDNLKYLKNKGSRDFLMELGIIKDAMALDVRIQSVFEKIGIQMPESFNQNKVYDEVENDILNKICGPIGLLGVELDRMLYQNYRQIMEII